MQTTNNTILITGGASGIGLALTQAFLQRNNRVLVVGRNESKLESVRNQNPAVETIVCDITSHEQRDRLLVAVEQRYPELNVLINNAGVQFNYKTIEDMSASGTFPTEIQTNLTAPVELTRLLLPTLLSQRSSAVVNITSALGLVPKKNAPGYCASKGGLHIFSQSLRHLLADTPIKVFEVIPPLVATKMTDGRGTGKISTDTLIAEFFKGFERDNFEMAIGKVRLLQIIQRFSPALAQTIMKNKQ